VLGEQSDGMGRPALASADEAEGFAGRRFHGDLKWGNLQGVGDVLAHPVHVGSNLGLFEDDGRINILDIEPVLREKVSDMLEENQAGDPLEPWIAVGKVPPDIPESRRTQERISDGMQEHVGVRVPGKAPIVGDFNAAEYAWPSRNEAVDIVSESYASG